VSLGLGARVPTSDALDGLCHFEDYAAETLVAVDDCLFGYTGYPAYPVTVVDDPTYRVVLEGELYGVEDVATEMRSLAPRLFGEDPAAVADFVCDADGDFLVCAREKRSGAVAVVNDVFGRLPTYYHVGDDRTICSREVGFVLDAVDVTFDRIGVAQSLLFGYTLGARTLWSGVRKLPPATLLQVDPDGTATTTDLHTFDFDGSAHADRSLERNVAELRSLFVEACRARGRRPGEAVLSLSGGHDSRTVAAAFREADVSFTAATFARSEDDTDAEVAAEVASALDVDWDRYDLTDPSPDPDRMATLLRLKEGMNPLSMGFILEFFDELRSRHGSSMNYVTGDGGDKALPSLRPAQSLSNAKALLDYVVARNAVFEVDRAADIAGVSESALLESIRARLSSYPERDPETRYVHFLVHERGFNWLNEGEDRNRYYFWSLTPFYSPAFFRYAMNVPPEQKTHNEFYREFLADLWPKAVELDHANFRTPMSSPRYRAVMYGLSFLERHLSLYDAVREVYRGQAGDPYDPNLAELLDRQLDHCDAVEDVLVPGTVREVVEDRHGFEDKQVYQLLTVSSAVERRECEAPVLERATVAPAGSADD
jgi:asparagine synthase (glutamine-hydrolysing)